jgi:hypothetical protein
MPPLCTLVRLNWTNPSSRHEWCVTTSVTDIGQGSNQRSADKYLTPGTQRSTSSKSPIKFSSVFLCTRKIDRVVLNNPVKPSMTRMYLDPYPGMPSIFPAFIQLQAIPIKCFHNSAWVHIKTPTYLVQSNLVYFQSIKRICVDYFHIPCHAANLTYIRFQEN